MVRVQLPLRMGVLGATDIARDFIKACGIEMTAHARQATVSAIIHVLGILIMSLSMSSARAADPLAGDRLYEDVRRFESFGPHRFGSAGATQAMAWIADELKTAGFEVRTQNFDMPRQYDFESGTLTVDGRSIPVTPHWWMPLAQASFALTAPIAPSGGDAHRKFVRLSLPFDNRAYLTAQHRQRLEAAFARGAAAVLLTIEHPSGEIYTYNVDQADTPWPLPVILVPQHERAALDAAEAAGQLLTVDIKGAYRSNVAGHNVIGRMNHGKGRTIVVSTPVTSWFTSTCERGPGIAGFLAMARLAKDFAGADLVFVATAGHEIGHGGMERFIHSEAPKPDAVAAWVHFGASIACYQWQRRDDHWTTDKTVNAKSRLLNRTQSLDGLVRRHFTDIDAIPRIGAEAAIGELRDVHAAGYANFMGMAGLHDFFHTPADRAAATGPEILAPVIHAFARTIAEIAAAK